MNISVVGLGKLGLPMAVAIAHKGHRVIGVDISDSVLTSLRNGRPHIQEPEVDELLAKSLAKKKFSVTDNFEEAVHRCDITFIAVNTPDKENFEMDLSQIETASRLLGRALKKKRKFHVIAITSTILPETVSQIALPILEETSGKKAGKGFGICSNPVFIALSTVVRDLLRPPVITLGESDSRTGDLLEKFYTSFCENNPPVIRTTPVMAEFIKLAHNAFCTTKMAFINEMALACSKIPGADIKALSAFFKAGGERQGKFLEAGMGFGGPCFPRDLKYFIHYVAGKVSNSPLLQAVDVSNQDYAERIAEWMESETGSLEGKCVAVLGLAYKPNSDITERSFALRLIEILGRRGARIQAYDPKVRHPQNRSSLKEALNEADCAIIATAWDEFKNLKPAVFTQWMRRAVLLDPWRLFEPRRWNKALLKYVTLGNGPATKKMAAPVKVC